MNDYAVDGQVVVDSLRVQSAGEAGGEGGVGVGVGADSTVSIDGAAVQSQNSGAARASVAFESGAQLEANDNRRGVVRITADGGDQVIQANVSGDASQEGDGRVVVSGDDGAQGTFIVVGEGNVSANGDGQVTAAVGEGGQVVYRQYDGERSDDDESQEQFIANGTATAELYYQQASESGESSGDRAVNVVNYGQDTTVEVTERSASTLNATVERSQSEGKVVLVSVSEAAMENAESTSVYVDGEAAAEASSYSEVASAANGGDNSAFLVRSSSSAEATTDVVVGINGFSERELSMQADGGDGTTSSGGQPGFGAVAALVALVGAALLATRRR